MTRDIITTFAENIFDNGQYTLNHTYYEYRKNYKRPISEVDIMGYLDGVLVLVEHKLSDTKQARKKAKQQLYKHRKHLVLNNQKYVLVMAFNDLHFEVLEEGIKHINSYSTLVPNK